MDDFFRSPKLSLALLEAHLLPVLLPSSCQQKFSTIFCLGPPRSPLLPVPHQPEPAPALWTIFIAPPSPLQPCWRPTCCLCCSPPAASSNFRLFFAWDPPEAPCCLCLTTLSLHQHCGRFLSLPQALFSPAGGLPAACAAPLHLPAANYDFVLPGPPQKPLAACASPL